MELATDALVHGVVFIGLLYLVGKLSRRVATYKKAFIKNVSMEQFNEPEIDQYANAKGVKY